MRTYWTKLSGIILAGALAVPVAVVAQANLGPGPGSCPGCGRMGGPGRMGARGGRAFDPKAVTTIQGQVVDVQRTARGRHQGVHLTVAMGSENLAVLLGPDFYVDAQPLKLAKGDQVEVKGARTTFGGQPVIIAQEVRRGDQVLALRDADGVPLWRGQGMGAR
ncbi:MAG TPA: hypothetical protein VF841_15815 [Anaeromyxobacter sp.]